MPLAANPHFLMIKDRFIVGDFLSPFIDFPVRANEIMRANFRCPDRILWQETANDGIWRATDGAGVRLKYKDEGVYLYRIGSFRGDAYAPNI